MLRKPNRNVYALNLCVLSCIVVLGVACATPVKVDEQPVNSRFLAENSAMKKRLPLIERENDVLKKENLQHRTKIQDLETQLGKLTADLTSLNEKYTNDTAADEEQIRILQDTIRTIEAESAEKIEGLISQNTALEEKRAGEVRALNEQMAMQKQAFGQEREQMMQASAKKELNLTGRMDDLKKAVEAKQLEITSLKMALNETSSKLGEATAMAETLRKSRDESVAELESVKAANVGLNKNLNEISRKISMQDSPPTSNH
jgi:chromosome segregation ATPase